MPLRPLQAVTTSEFDMDMRPFIIIKIIFIITIVIMPMEASPRSATSPQVIINLVVIIIIIIMTLRPLQAATTRGVDVDMSPVRFYKRYR